MIIIIFSLENNLRNYVCATKGDTIQVTFNKKNYQIDIIVIILFYTKECKPRDAICLTNCDVEVDFDQPLDYVEESKKVDEVI
jgi:ubiquitin fusion degradation protein 1